MLAYDVRRILATILVMAVVALFVFSLRYIAPSMAATAAPWTVRTLLRHVGAARSRALLAEFWSQTPPAYTAAEEGEAFIRFVSAAGLAIPGLDTALAEDAAELARWLREPA